MLSMGYTYSAKVLLLNARLFRSAIPIKMAFPITQVFDLKEFLLRVGHSLTRSLYSALDGLHTMLKLLLYSLKRFEAPSALRCPSLGLFHFPGTGTPIAFNAMQR